MYFGLFHKNDQIFERLLIQIGGTGKRKSRYSHLERDLLGNRSKKGRISHLWRHQNLPLPCEKSIEEPESSWKWNRRMKAQSAIIIIVIIFINLVFVSIMQYYKIIQIAVRLKN